MEPETEMFETPGPVTVRVLSNGAVAHEERCESVEQALLVIEAWEDVDGTRFEIADDLEPSLPPMPSEEYFASVDEPQMGDPRRD
jgi:hypothetical protein